MLFLLLVEPFQLKLNLLHTVAALVLNSKGCALRNVDALTGNGDLKCFSLLQRIG